ncbi:glycoside hydrolase family 43 protein, partial [Akkermansia sp.]|uniref:glycoside hydrolase family 43 protein n=1 Tax=Akkermansia sp. TaxID=1872421 RepID=UPI001D4F920A
SKDLYNWKDEGIALKVVEGDNSHPIAKGCILERPKVVYNKKTKKYVMWFHLELKGKGYGSAYAGVATATKPTGPFTFLRAGRVNPGKWPLNLDKKDQTTEFTKEMPDYVRIIRRDYPGGQMSRDMTIFVDDNGKAYHIYSSEGNITLHIAELTPDYTGHNGKYVRAFRSAVADRIAGPWKELKNPCVGPKAGITFGGQSTYILPVQGKPGKFIFMADIWRPKNAIDGRYLWLPMKWEGDQIKLEWKDEWTLEDL